jgi:hypothetical protein
MLAAPTTSRSVAVRTRDAVVASPASAARPARAVLASTVEEPSAVVESPVYRRAEPTVEAASASSITARQAVSADPQALRHETMRQSAETPWSPPTAAPRAQAEPATREVAVRIGAVRLEIHAPPPAAVAPAPAATPEPSRFTPRRYYLRG